MSEWIKLINNFKSLIKSIDSLCLCVNVIVEKDLKNDEPNEPKLACYIQVVSCIYNKVAHLDNVIENYYSLTLKLKSP